MKTMACINCILRTESFGATDFIRNDRILHIGLFIIIVLLVVIIVRQHKYHLSQIAKFRKMQYHDNLTGVYNYKGFVNRVEELIREHPDIPYMMSFNNIMDFKYINDSQGRNAANELLKFWVDKSLEVMSDVEAIGRLEGDHLALLLRIGGFDKMQKEEQQVFQPVQDFFVNRGKNLKVRIVSGIYVLMPEDYENIDVDRMIDLARSAERKLHENKKDGYEFYNPKQWEKGMRVVHIVGRFPLALKSKELRVWYQPQIDYDSGKIIGAEALCRWNNPDLGFIPPSEFIPALEDAGIIYDLNCYIWKMVCHDLAGWNKEGKHRCISVNVSRLDIQKNRELPEYFCDLVQEYDLTPDQLHIEITETAYVEDAELLINTTSKLREYGFQVEMDDFGSGYSSLNMLKEVPVDRIKLDLRFLTGSGNRRMGQTILKHVIMMARDLNTGIIAEGVEEKEQADFLHELGCHAMQGYLFHKPMPVEEFEELMEKMDSIS